MDGAAEAHNISFGCGRSAINIGPLSEDMMGGWVEGGGWRYQLSERMSEKKRGSGVSLPFFSPLLHQTRPRLLRPRSAERRRSPVLLVAL